MICPNCGKKLDVSKPSCSRCGEAIVLGGKINFNIDIQRAIPKDPVPVGVAMMPTNGVPVPPQIKKSKAGLYAVISVVAVLMITVIVMLFALSDDKKDIVVNEATSQSEEYVKIETNLKFKELYEQVKKGFTEENISNVSVDENSLIIYNGAKRKCEKYTVSQLLKIINSLDSEEGRYLNADSSSLVRMTAPVLKEKTKEIFKECCPLYKELCPEGTAIPDDIHPINVQLSFNVIGEGENAKLKFKSLQVDFSETVQGIKKKNLLAKSTVFKAAEELAVENNYKCIVIMKAEVKGELTTPKVKPQAKPKPQAQSKPQQEAPQTPPPAQGPVPEKKCDVCGENNCDASKHCSICKSLEHKTDYHCPVCYKPKHDGRCSEQK